MGYGNLFENPARIKASQPHNMAKVLYLDQGDLNHNRWEIRKLDERSPVPLRFTMIDHLTLRWHLGTNIVSIVLHTKGRN
jgi:hypothetical protein